MENYIIFKNGKPSINGPCSMAMLNNQRVNENMVFYSPKFFGLRFAQNWGFPTTKRSTT
jgi:hypothetical protein